MADDSGVLIPEIHEDQLPGSEAKLKPKPDWRPRYPGSGRLNPFGGQPPENIEDFGKDSPMGCPGQPNEVAPSFLFLACEDASYMTGQVLHPDGGESTSS